MKRAAFFPDFSSQKGVTLIEVLVAVAIMGFVSLMVAGTFSDIFKMQSQVIMRDEGNEFAASVARFIFTDSTCSAALMGQTFPVTGKSDLTLPGYLGYGSVTDPQTSKPTSLVTGIQIGNDLRVGELSIANAGLAPQTVLSDTLSLQRYLARVTLVVERKNGSQWQTSPPRTFQFPVLVDPTTHQISRCYLSMKIDDACQVLGSSLDPATGKCVPMTQCIFEGSFTVNTCNPSVGGCPANFVNELTGSTSCPSGVATQKETGAYDWSYTQSCGKKCTQTISVNTKYYVCLKCQ